MLAFRCVGGHGSWGRYVMTSSFIYEPRFFCLEDFRLKTCFFAKGPCQMLILWSWDCAMMMCERCKKSFDNSKRSNFRKPINTAIPKNQCWHPSIMDICNGPKSFHETMAIPLLSEMVFCGHLFWAKKRPVDSQNELSTCANLVA